MAKKQSDAGKAEETAFRNAALAHARRKDLRAENGITNRMDHLLDEMNKNKKGGKK